MTQIHQHSDIPRRPSIVGGTAIIAGTVIGAGMFSLPVVSAGMGFLWSFVWLALTGFCMLHTALLILETNLNFAPGSSFDTFIGETLGPRWKMLNNFSLVFVLYILCYAFISGGASSAAQTLHASMDVELSPVVSVVLYSLLVALIVWIGTSTVGRVTTVIVAGMVISFALSIAQLMSGMRPALLVDVHADYFVYSFAALPVYLASFGFHTNVPSLLKFYGKEPATISKCLVYGTTISLAVYTVWQAVTLGQISRDEWIPIMQQGGNIGPMVATISGQDRTGMVMPLLTTFANLAVISSFLGGALGLFDFIADACKFSDDYFGRLKSTALTFLPPTVICMFFPNGFILAIGFVGLIAVVFAIIIPIKAAKVSRQKFGNPLFRVWGGDRMLYLLYGYGALVAICHILAAAGRLPVFGR
jgi:tryptophan-specific transport protein